MSKVMPLPTSARWLRAPRGAYEIRTSRGVRPHAHGEDPAVPGLRERLLVEHLDLELVLLARGDGGRREGLRVQEVGGRVDPVAGLVDAGRDGDGGGDRILRLGLRRRGDQRQGAQQLGRVAADLRVRVRTQQSALPGPLDDLGFDQVHADHHVERGGRLEPRQGPNAVGHRPANLLRRHVDVTEPDDDEPYAGSGKDDRAARLRLGAEIERDRQRRRAPALGEVLLDSGGQVYEGGRARDLGETDDEGVGVTRNGLRQGHRDHEHHLSCLPQGTSPRRATVSRRL